MTRRQTWWCVATLVLFMGGCAEDVPMQELGKLNEMTPKPKQEEKPPEDAFALPPSTEEPTATDSAQGDQGQTEPAPVEQSAAAPPANSGYGGYGAVSTGPNTFGQPAEIKLASEVQGVDLAKAEGGVGKRGQGYGGGIITEPVRQYFIAQDRIKLNIEIPNNLKMYKALTNNQNPPTVEAFVKEVLDVSNILLPELKKGEFYVYDPAGKDLDAVLFVARPRQ
ncbi:MAG: hypothetical protein WD894_25515 [Pirellulales bacterium]